jgi:hypothetical protein
LSDSIIDQKFLNFQQLDLIGSEAAVEAYALSNEKFVRKVAQGLNSSKCYKKWKVGCPECCLKKKIYWNNEYFVNVKLKNKIYKSACAKYTIAFLSPLTPKGFFCVDGNTNNVHANISAFKTSHNILYASKSYAVKIN